MTLEELSKDFDPQIRVNNFTVARKTIAEDKALDTRLLDTETARMYANIFILNRTETQMYVNHKNTVPSLCLQSSRGARWGT